MLDSRERTPNNPIFSQKYCFFNANWEKREILFYFSVQVKFKNSNWVLPLEQKILASYVVSWDPQKVIQEPKWVLPLKMLLRTCFLYFITLYEHVYVQVFDKRYLTLWKCTINNYGTTVNLSKQCRTHAW